jgi:hypothetical protein
VQAGVVRAVGRPGGRLLHLLQRRRFCLLARVVRIGAPTSVLSLFPMIDLWHDLAFFLLRAMAAGSRDCRLKHSRHTALAWKHNGLMEVPDPEGDVFRRQRWRRSSHDGRGTGMRPQQGIGPGHEVVLSTLPCPRAVVGVLLPRSQSLVTTELATAANRV